MDLQSFTSDDFEYTPDRPKSGEGCIRGEDKADDSGNLCDFAYLFSFCPETVCVCTAQGKLRNLPAEDPGSNARFYDEWNVDLNRLCHFACKYGFCPSEECRTEPEEDDTETRDPNTPAVIGDDPSWIDPRDAHDQNMKICLIYKDMAFRDDSVLPCRETCQKQLDEAAEEERMSNYGCVGSFPLDKPIPWRAGPHHALVVPGQCVCNHWLVNELGEVFIELMPALAQVRIYASFCWIFQVLTLPDWMLHSHVSSQTRT